MTPAADVSNGTGNWIGNVGRRVSRESPRDGGRGQHPATANSKRTSSVRDAHDPRAASRRPRTASPDRFRNESNLLPAPDHAIVTVSPLEILNPSDAHLLRKIYRAGFDAIFSSWMSSYGCPFLSENSVGAHNPSILEICEHLDGWMREMSLRDPAMILVPEHSGGDRENDSLRGSIAAFSARWLPLTSGNPEATQWCHHVVHALWRHARRDMMRVINRPSYRSMLTLFLFALTPIPAGISEEEELDGISGQACIHAALQQIQTLRARQRSVQFNGTKVSQPARSRAIVAIPEAVATEGFLTAENIAYWAALTFDTSASLTLNCRPLLSAGLLGFEAELPWRLVRAGAVKFQKQMQEWHAHAVSEITDERASQIVASGSAWKLLAWKLTAVFKEALRDGHDESEVKRAFRLVSGFIQEFNDIYREPLEACQRRMPFLGEQIRFRWYSLMLHYHLSILLLVNAAEATSRLDLLAELAEASADAQNAVVNTLIFGLSNTVTLNIPQKSDYSCTLRDGIPVPIVAIDPYPHHIVAAVQLVHKAVDRDLTLGRIGGDAHKNLQSVLSRALDHLPQSSKSVQAAKGAFSERSSHSGVEPLVPYLSIDPQWHR
ncbi:hypothetical protein BDV23DRAFT_184328 [Aspergillus alliaceus]|uniref:Uncharacterized protein n=1 Tax=Petromyces alliaceus TaxID=209559 RepID=A0A5N7C629_PETAA|nr:hypothetical protein BDV23DRAFT_184328 [Aspergillus alliaceus]